MVTMSMRLKKLNANLLDVICLLHPREKMRTQPMPKLELEDDTQTPLGGLLTYWGDVVVAGDVAVAVTTSQGHRWMMQHER
jgi:hypothetical protein